MRSAISLLVLLLFSMCGVQTRSTQTEVQPESQGTGAAASAAEVSTQLDVSAELKELRDMVVEQSGLLKEMEERLEASETQVAVLERVAAVQQKELTAVKTDMMNMKVENAAAEERLLAKVAALETENAEQETELAAVEERLLAKVAALEKVTADQETELTAVRERLVTSETKVAALERVNGVQDERLSAGETTVEELKTTVEELKMDNAAQTAELTAVKTRLADTEAELTAVKTRLAETETEVDTLKAEITGAPKVAFSAGLTSTKQYIEAVNGDMNLVFSNIITKVGEGYNSQTGVFTAPVKGVYYFRYTAMDWNRSARLAIRTLLNGKQVMLGSAYDDNGSRIRGYNGLTLLLEEGDTVNLRLDSGGRVWDEGDGFLYTNFSGFLLFPL